MIIWLNCDVIVFVVGVNDDIISVVSESMNAVSPDQLGKTSDRKSAVNFIIM